MLGPTLSFLHLKARIIGFQYFCVYFYIIIEIRGHFYVFVIKLFISQPLGDIFLVIHFVTWCLYTNTPFSTDDKIDFSFFYQSSMTSKLFRLNSPNNTPISEWVIDSLNLSIWSVWAHVTFLKVLLCILFSKTNSKFLFSTSNVWSTQSLFLSKTHFHPNITIDIKSNPFLGHPL